MSARVGIQAAAGYCGTACVEVPDLFEARGLDTSRMDNLMMSSKSVPLPCEDIVSFATNAAAPIVADLSKQELDRIDTLIVATESGIDFAKSAGTYVHDLLRLPRSCRLFEVKQACYAGIAALQCAAALTAASPGSLALVIAGDLPAPQRGGYAEPSQGAGAVAVLVGRPDVAELHLGRSGFCSFETTDFCRPRPDLDLVDIDHSLLSYIDCLLGSFNDYAARFPGTDFGTSFHALAMHTPFPGMVKGAHRTAMRKLTGATPAEVETDFGHRVAPSVRLPRQVGNIYSGSTLLALLSVLGSPACAPGSDIGVFSYGGGCSAEFLKVTKGPHLPGGVLGSRARLDIETYDALADRLGDGAFGVERARLDPAEWASLVPRGERRFMLSAVDGYHRRYVRIEGDR
jgi:polyketide biosynthesis 3-hydroxy-3-methylglutaryl-CoA synthase-like enzyme PksG